MCNDLEKGIQVKYSFKMQVILIVLSTLMLIGGIILFMDYTKKRARYAQLRAQRMSDYGLQVVMGGAMSSMGDIHPDLLVDTCSVIQGEGTYQVSVKKDTISVDTIQVEIRSEGMSEKAVGVQIRKVLLGRADSMKWMVVE